MLNHHSSLTTQLCYLIFNLNLFPAFVLVHHPSLSSINLPMRFYATSHQSA